MLAKISVADYMSTNIVSVVPDSEIFQAIKKMLEHKVTSVPVIDSHGQLVGIFSETDGIKVVVESAYNQSMDAKVADRMCKVPVSVDAAESLVDVATKFEANPVRSFPVFQEGELVGMISRVDVLRALLAL